MTMPVADTLYSEPRGIGGWLILVMLGLVIAPFFALGALGQGFTFLANDMTSGVRIFVISIIIFNLSMMIAWIVAAIRFFKRKRSFPKFFIMVLMIDFLGVLIFTFIEAGVFDSPLTWENYKELIRPLVSLLIWAPYIARSKRVRNTFTQN
jgi:hypothetical protein